MESNLQNLMGAIDAFAAERDWGQFHTPKNLASSIAIEAAELVACFQWSDPTCDMLQLDDSRMARVSEEIADVLNYSLRLCSLLALDPINIVAKKLALNAQKYPVALSKGNSKKYSEHKNGA